jgi:hypothetical protein
MTKENIFIKSTVKKFISSLSIYNTQSKSDILIDDDAKSRMISIDATKRSRDERLEGIKKDFANSSRTANQSNKSRSIQRNNNDDDDDDDIVAMMDRLNN